MGELQRLIGSTVVLSTPDTAVRGVVAAASRKFVTIRDAQRVDLASPVEIVGAVLIPVSQISYVQVVS